MPPKATIEDVDEFDDDTDLPLPSRALPNTGTRGALLEEISSDEEEEDSTSRPPNKPKSALSTTSGSSANNYGLPRMPPGSKVTTDKSQFKNWLQIYPIYIDAKQPFKTGYRRIAREKSVWWPLSLEIAQAASMLGLNVVHEAQASHPRDWENPGRVRIHWEENGKLLKPQFKTKKQLFEVISGIIQQRRPDLVPKLDTPQPDKAEMSLSVPQASSSKVPLPSKQKQRKVHTPRPPKPYPPIAQRVSGFSPVVVSGVLIDAVKAGMDAMKQQQAEAQNAAAAAGVGKGKRKVVRVRG
ncbi:signal recognition particle subunit [Serendipita sp. 411]|nr:signal recognition particle subunit [Serendipita sp. 411]